MIKAIIFDCFGVLITDALEAIISDLRATDADRVEHIISQLNWASKGSIDADASRAAIADMLGITIDEYKDKIRRGEVRNQQLFDYIKELRPGYKTGLLSNVSSGGLEVRFASGELAEYFDVVVASSDIGYAKPEAHAYEITADKLGVRLDECVMIDDRGDYCMGATGVGMRAIQYQSFEQMKTELMKHLEL